MIDKSLLNGLEQSKNEVLGLLISKGINPSDVQTTNNVLCEIISRIENAWAIHDILINKIDHQDFNPSIKNFGSIPGAVSYKIHTTSNSDFHKSSSSYFEIRTDSIEFYRSFINNQLRYFVVNLFGVIDLFIVLINSHLYRSLSSAPHPKIDSIIKGVKYLEDNKYRLLDPILDCFITETKESYFKSLRELRNSLVHNSKSVADFNPSSSSYEVTLTPGALTLKVESFTEKSLISIHSFTERMFGLIKEELKSNPTFPF